MMVYVKRILTLAVFALGLVVLLFVLSFVFVPKNNMSEFGMEEAAANGILGEKPDTIDMIVLGDSETYSSISPMEIWKNSGYTSYVCGTSGQTLDYTLLMLERVFEKQTPKIVILETNAVYRDLASKNGLIAKCSRYFSIFWYHDRWKSLGWHDFVKKPNYTWTDDYKGYKHSIAANACKKTDYMIPTEAAEEISEANAEYVNEIQTYCVQNDAKLILVSTPSAKNWNYGRHNAIQELADEIGCEYMDLNLMNEQLKIDWSRDTRDKGDHLNYYGAVKVSRFLAGYLSETGMLEDHRADTKYRKWEDSLTKYESAVGKSEQ